MISSIDILKNSKATLQSNLKDLKQIIFLIEDKLIKEFNIDEDIP